MRDLCDQLQLEVDNLKTNVASLTATNKDICLQNANLLREAADANVEKQKCDAETVPKSRETVLTNLAQGYMSRIFTLEKENTTLLEVI